MPRHKNSESKIQSDPILFSKICEEIYSIGPVVLGNFGLVSRTTIHDYTKGKPVTASAEEGILNSIEKWKAKEQEAAQARANKARTLLDI